MKNLTQKVKSDEKHLKNPCKKNRSHFRQTMREYIKEVVVDDEGFHEPDDQSVSPRDEQ